MARVLEPRPLLQGAMLQPVRAAEEVQLQPWVRLPERQGPQKLLPLPERRHGLRTARESLS